MRVKLGPVSLSSTGRVGVKAGPVYVSGGGRRRRRGSTSSGGWGAVLLFLIALAVVALIFLYAVVWPLSLWGHAIHLTPSWHQLMHRDHTWMHEHYPLVGLRYLEAFGLLLLLLAAIFVAVAVPVKRGQAERERLAAAQAIERRRQAHALAVEREQQVRKQAAQRLRSLLLARERWLEGPPPPLQLPGRFTQTWIARNVPELHPGQVPVLLEELRRRGWSEPDIERRVAPYLPLTA